MELNQKDISKQVISMDKKYKTRDGRSVRVLCIDCAGNVHYPVLALILEWNGDETLSSFTPEGKYSGLLVRNKDLIEVSPYEDFKVDDKVLVSQDGKQWYKRYFSHVSDKGNPCAFDLGSTSWNGQYVTEWNFCKKAEE